MNSITILIIVFAFLGFILYRERKNNEFEIDRFREFVRAIKTKTIAEYEQSIPIKVNEPNEVEEVKNEFIELDQVDPKELLNTIRKQ